LCRGVIGSGPFCCHIEDFKRYFALLLADISCGLGRLASISAVFLRF
jgi:hypothetical protein